MYKQHLSKNKLLGEGPPIGDLMHTLLQDVRYAGRMMGKNPAWRSWLTWASAWS